MTEFKQYAIASIGLDQNESCSLGIALLNEILCLPTLLTVIIFFVASVDD